MAFKGFQRLASNLRKLGDVPSRAAAMAASRIQDEIDTAVSSGLDPYGRPFAALLPATLKRWPSRSDPALATTGIDGAARVAPTSGSGIAITVDHRAATFHQTGTKYMAQRQILPQSGDLPESWRAAIAASIEEAYRGALR